MYSWRVGGTHPNRMHSCYRLQWNCEGYVFTPVCHSAPGGGIPGQVPLPRTRYTPQDQVQPPGPGAPPGTSYTPNQLHPQVHTPWTRYLPWTEWQTATVADGTHPTGMHSCLTRFLQKTAWKWKKFDREGGGVRMCPAGSANALTPLYRKSCWETRFMVYLHSTGMGPGPLQGPNGKHSTI